MNDLRKDVILGKQFSSSRLVQLFRMQTLIYLLVVLSKIIMRVIFNNNYFIFSFSADVIGVLNPMYLVITICVFLVMIFWGTLLVISYLEKINRVRMIHISNLFFESLLVGIILLIERF